MYLDFVSLFSLPLCCGSVIQIIYFGVNGMSLKFERFAIIPASATMFDAEQRFDAAAQKRLIAMLLSKNVDGFYVAGASGEAFLMTPEERKAVISVSLEAIGGRVPAIVYTGSNDTKTAVELSQFAQKEGADAISSVRPYYGGFSAEQIRSYYKTVSECVDIPLIVYNNPTARMSGMGEIMDICTLPNCGGIKYTLTNHYEMALIKRALGDKLVLSGVDEMFASGMAAGADGAIGTTYNLAPELFWQIRDAFENGRNDEVIHLNRAAACLIELLLRRSYMACMKAILQSWGIGTNMTKAPNSVLTEDEFQALRAELMSLRTEFDIRNVALFDRL